MRVDALVVTDHSSLVTASGIVRRVMAVAPADLRWHEEVDVGIVGAGGCGLWEKAAAPGGSTALSAGSLIH
jgi:ribulose 1,5-bisphosphate synthetase/thiazole synthase